jgi:mono/diheme cytochrome c family protein
MATAVDVLFVVGAAGAAVAAFAGPQEAGPGGDLAARFATDFTAFVETHCASCHSGAAPEGGLDLARIATLSDVVANETLLKHALERVERGQMPPDPAAAPSPEATAALGRFLRDAARASYEPALAGDPGEAPLRRLTNSEYENSVFDVLGVRFDAAAAFPADAIGHGFDNVAEAQVLSELLLERQLEAAHEIAERAIAWEPPGEPRVQSFSPRDISGGRSNDESRILTSNGECAVLVKLPRAGDYVLRALVHADQAGDELARLELRRAGATLATFDVKSGKRGEPETHEAPFTIEEGGEVWVAAAFVNDFYKAEGERRADRNLHVHGIEVVGPLGAPRPTALQLALAERFASAKSEKERLRAQVQWLGERLWRRPLGKDEVGRLVDLAPKNAEEAQSLQYVIAALLASPRFTYRFENDAPVEGGVRDLDAFELATRLSYFVWSSCPDEQLFEAAKSGALQDDAKLADEVRRMLDDPKAGALARNFAAQWLQTRRLGKHAVDAERFPDVTRELLDAMERETLLVFESVLREKRPIGDLLDADFTFVNQELAAHYGLPEVEGAYMRRVSLAGSPRRGIVLHGSVLTVTSEPGRTSPVKRGKWLLDTLLGTPLPPPPPGADSFGDEDPTTFSAATLRERIASHRARPACAACHDQLDPLGFALERFDAVGRWRDRDGKEAIDASGVLPSGESFDGALELVARIRAFDADGDWIEGPSLVRSLVEKLLVYALGRGLTPADRPTIGRVLASLDRERPTIGDAILAIAQSDAFTRRRTSGAQKP